MTAINRRRTYNMGGNMARYLYSAYSLYDVDTGENIDFYGKFGYSPSVSNIYYHPDQECLIYATEYCEAMNTRSTPTIGLTLNDLRISRITKIYYFKEDRLLDLCGDVYLSTNGNYYSIVVNLSGLVYLVRLDENQKITKYYYLGDSNLYWGDSDQPNSNYQRTIIYTDDNSVYYEGVRSDYIYKFDLTTETNSSIGLSSLRSPMGSYSNYNNAM